MIELFDLILGLTADVDAQAFIELGILLREDDGEVGIATPEIVQLLQHPLRQRIGDGGDGQGDEHLVRVQAGIVVAQVPELHIADGCDDGGRQQIQLLVDAGQELDGVEQRGGGGPQEGAGLAGDYPAVRQHDSPGGGTGLGGPVQRGLDGGADLRGDPGLLHDDLQLAHHALVALASDPVYQARIVAPEDLHAVDIAVPGDISSAAFFLVAGAIVPGSELTIKNVGVNPTRTGVLDVLRDMGADITESNFRDEAEPMCDLTVKYSKLHGVEIGGAIIPRLIDELPVIAVAAAFAEGETVIRDAQELKVKESNRIAAMVAELTKAGVDVEETDDGMIVHGGAKPHGASFETYKDHRIAMSLAVLGLAAEGASRIDEPEVVAISYPDFFNTLERLGD